MARVAISEPARQLTRTPCDCNVNNDNIMIAFLFLNVPGTGRRWSWRSRAGRSRAGRSFRWIMRRNTRDASGCRPLPWRQTGCFCAAKCTISVRNASSRIPTDLEPEKKRRKTRDIESIQQQLQQKKIMLRFNGNRLCHHPIMWKLIPFLPRVIFKLNQQKKIHSF